MSKYIVATLKDWNINQYNTCGFSKNKKFILITDPKKLTFKNINTIKPKYIFFPHWSFKVNEKIINNFNCVCFHETKVPYGRGGSPIQNLIEKNHKNTFITALKMSNILDAGPIYMRDFLSLKGSAEEIYERASIIIFKMIKKIIIRNPKPFKQKGKVTIFKRRKPSQSNILKNISSLNKIYNHIRMLDAKSYPNAYIKYGKMILEFKSAKFGKKNIEAKVNIRLFSKKNDKKK